MSDPRIIGPGLLIRRRCLPHWQQGGAAYFVTFRLRHAARGHGPTSPTPLVRAERAVVRQYLLQEHQQTWQVHLFTVMPTHVHLLATPLPAGPGQWHALGLVAGRAKGRSSRDINAARGERGPLWQADGRDSIIRTEDDLEARVQYILFNAVEAGLVADPWAWDGLWGEGQAEWQNEWGLST